MPSLSFLRSTPRPELTVIRQPLAPVLTASIGRQAIFTADLDLFGHELLFRGSEQAAAADLMTIDEHDAATSQVLTATFADFDPYVVSGGMPLFINLTRAFVVGELPMVCGPDSIVLELTEHISIDEEVLAGILRLKEEGYRLALDDFAGEEDRLAALEHMRYVKLVLEPGERDALAELVGQVRELAPYAKIVVEKVETPDDLAFCRSLGVDLMQGYGLERPVTLSAKTLEASQVVALRLIAALTNPDTHMRDVEALVEADPGLSLRVLRAASSSMVAARSPISTVRQALVLLGPRPLTAWAVLTAMKPGSNSAQQRVAMMHVLHRAGACSKLLPSDAHTAYTAGLLSATADVLAVPIEELLSGIHVHDAVRDALLHFDGEVGRALAAILACEGRLPGTATVDVGSDAATAYLAAMGDALKSVKDLSRA